MSFHQGHPRFHFIKGDAKDLALVKKVSSFLGSVCIAIATAAAGDDDDDDD